MIRIIRPVTKKTWDAEGIQLKFSVFSVYSLIKVCLPYPETHYAGWIEPDNPGFCQRPKNGKVYQRFHQIKIPDKMELDQGY